MKSIEISGQKAGMQAAVTIYRFNVRGTNIDLLATPRREDFVQFFLATGKMIPVQGAFFIEEDPKVFMELLSFSDSNDKQNWRPSDLKLLKPLINAATNYGISYLHTRLALIYDVLSIRFSFGRDGEYIRSFEVDKERLAAFPKTEKYLSSEFAENQTKREPLISRMNLVQKLIPAMHEDGMHFDGTVEDKYGIMFNFSAI